MCSFFILMFFRLCTGRMNQNGGTRSVSQQDAGPRGKLETDKDFVATAWKDGKVTLPSNCEDCQVKCKTKLGKTLSELWCPLIRTSMKDASWCPQFEISTGIELFQNLWHAYRHSCAVVKTHLLAVGPERVTLNAVSSCWLRTKINAVQAWLTSAVVSHWNECCYSV